LLLFRIASILHCVIDGHRIIEHCSVYSLGVLAFLGTFFAAFAVGSSSCRVTSRGSAEALGVDLVHVFAALAVVGEGGQSWSLWVGGRVGEDQVRAFVRMIVLGGSL
jgi:hypothetical protein